MDDPLPGKLGADYGSRDAWRLYLSDLDPVLFLFQPGYLYLLLAANRGYFILNGRPGSALLSPRSLFGCLLLMTMAEDDFSGLPLLGLAAHEPDSVL
jgi:hypothetical protein